VSAKTKGQALDDFTARLLSSPMKDHIARIVLFGSVLDGEDQPNSDVDVLVFGTGRLRELSEACAKEPSL
jgi:predicted nucleotidyltransferase